VNLVPINPATAHDDVYRLPAKPTQNVVSSKRSALNQQQQLEYVPLQTVSYASQRNQQSTQNMASVDLKDKTADTINQEYYSQQVPPEGSHAGPGLGQKEGLSQGDAGAKKESSLGNFSGYAPLRTDLSTQDNINHKFNDFVSNNGTAFTNKSKSNISLMPQDMNHVSQAQTGSDATAYSSAIRTQAAQDFKIGKLSKYSVKLPQHQNNPNFVDKRASNHYSSDATAAQYGPGSSSRFLLNKDGDAASKLPSISGNNQQIQGSTLQDKRYQLSVDQ
jgi:hypothetical protein